MILLHQNKALASCSALFPLKARLPKGEHLLRSLLPHGTLFPYVLHTKWNGDINFFNTNEMCFLSKRKKQPCKSKTLLINLGETCLYPHLYTDYPNMLICFEHLTLEGQGWASWIRCSNHQRFLWGFRAITEYVTAWLEMVMIYRKVVDD